MPLGEKEWRERELRFSETLACSIHQRRHLLNFTMLYSSSIPGNNLCSYRGVYSSQKHCYSRPEVQGVWRGGRGGECVGLQGTCTFHLSFPFFFFFFLFNLGGRRIMKGLRSLDQVCTYGCTFYLVANMYGSMYVVNRDTSMRFDSWNAYMHILSREHEQCRAEEREYEINNSCMSCMSCICSSIISIIQT